MPVRVLAKHQTEVNPINVVETPTEVVPGEPLMEETHIDGHTLEINSLVADIDAALTFYQVEIDTLEAAAQDLRDILTSVSSCNIT